MKKLLGKKAALLSSILLSCAILFSGCGNEETESATEVESSEAVGEEAEIESEYNNSYCVDGVPSETLTRLRDQGELIVGSSGDVPFAYIDEETGDFLGVDAEIIKEVANRLGIEEVSMALIPFSELIINLNSGNIDIIADCMYVRPDRAEQVYFGDIWYTQGGGLLIPDDDNITGLVDFDADETVVGYTPGTIWQPVVEGWVAEGLIKEARGTGDQSESITALQYGKIDAFLTDSTVVENLLANSPEVVEGLKLASDYEDTEDTIGRIAPAVTFDDIAFAKEVDNVVEELRSEGFIEKVFADSGLDPSIHMITNEEKEHDVNTRTE